MMKISAEALVWVFAILGGLRIFIILRRHEISSVQYKKWAIKLAFILIWFLGIYALVSYSRIPPLVEAITDRYAWVATNGNGLWLRASPDKNAEIVQDTAFHNNILVPKRSRIIVLEKDLNPETIDGQSGAWCKVEYNGYQGYCFDGWLIMEFAVLELPKTYITLLEKEDKKQAWELQTRWTDYEGFISPDQLFGAVTKTKTMSHSFGGISGQNTAEVNVTFYAINPSKDETIKAASALNCEHPGIVYKMKFLIRKEPDGKLKIADFIPLDLKCPNASVNIL